MTTTIYLGNPPANVKTWIDEHNTSNSTQQMTTGGVWRIKDEYVGAGPVFETITLSQTNNANVYIEEINEIFDEQFVSENAKIWTNNQYFLIFDNGKWWFTEASVYMTASTDYWRIDGNGTEIELDPGYLAGFTWSAE